MSLDAYLHGITEIVQCRCAECGHTHTREQWLEVYSANITHNLARMADAAGIYKHLWRPDEMGVTHARDLIDVLTAGLSRLEAEADLFRQYNAANGWGTYDQFVPWVRNYLNACKANPDAEVSVSR